MTITQTIHAKTTVSMTDLRRNPSKILEIARDLPVAVLNHNKPEAYLLSAKAYEALLDLVDDLSLIKIIKARSSGKTVKVKLEDYSLEFNVLALKEWQKLDNSVRS